MTLFEMIFVGGVVATFAVVGVALFYGWAQTRDLFKPFG